MDKTQDTKQSSLVGTMVTMKDDISFASSASPQQRLQRSGNFIQEAQTRKEHVETQPVEESSTKLPLKEPSTTAESEPVPISLTSNKTEMPSQTQPEIISSPSTPTKDLSGFAFDLDPFATKPSSQDNDPKPLTNVSDNSKSSVDFSLNLGTKPISLSEKTPLKTGYADDAISELDSESDPVPEKAKKSKLPYFIGGGLVLLSIIGLVLFMFGGQLGLIGEMPVVEPPSDIDFSQPENGEEDQNADEEENEGGEIEDQESNPIEEANISPVEDVAFVTVPLSTNNLRTDLLNALTTQSGTLVEVGIVDDQGDLLQFSQFIEAMGLQVPNQIQNSTVSYWPYVYNQEGIFKIVLVIQLEPASVASQLLLDWLPSIPQDLSGFSLTSSSRSVNEGATMNTVEVQTPQGVPISNFFYNYTDSANSIDVTYYQNYLLFASSQESMRSLRSSIDF